MINFEMLLAKPCRFIGGLSWYYENNEVENEKDFNLKYYVHLIE